MTFDLAWEHLHRQREYGRAYDPRMCAFLWREFGYLKEQRHTVAVLDLGCGVGAQTVEIANMGFSACGIDAAPSALARAREWLPPKFERLVQYHQADMARLPCGDAQFDAAVDVCSLECLSEPDLIMALGEVVRVLKPGGILFSMTETFENDVRDPIYGPAPRRMTLTDVGAIYGAFFKGLEVRKERHRDAMGEPVSLWIIEGRTP